MKITTFAALAFTIALSGLAHADQEGREFAEQQRLAPPPVQQPIDPGYYGGEYGGGEVIARETQVDRRRIIVEGGVQGEAYGQPPAVLPIPGGPGYGPRRPLTPPFPAEYSVGCDVSRSNFDPRMVQITIFYRGQKPFPFEILDPGYRGENLQRSLGYLRSMGFCLR